MDKLIEREPAARNPLVAAPALAVQFFLIPLVVVGVTVLVYSAFVRCWPTLVRAQDYVAEVRIGGSNRRWPAAYELSRLMADPKVRADRTLAPALVKAFEDRPTTTIRACGDIWRWRSAGWIRRCRPQAVAGLTKALDDPDGEARISAIWALGSSGDRRSFRSSSRSTQSTDAGIRKMVVYALGALPGETQIETLRDGAAGSDADVRWNAAVALARHGSRDGVPVLRQMLDRAVCRAIVKRDVRQDDDQDPIADVMISGLRAAAALKDAVAQTVGETLSQQDRSMRVRQAALEALKVMG